ncbi:putative Co/Zn/Cd cation transporter (cation efflux family) [Pseudochelatococcus lubricantis]|uniref:Co/Zn/Cd cation transporter (Cation efflux family) n=1 Tax=Pseudochelatococcus lubricantis TaxID=1538102 RepID=A0ABX0UTE9_9HYPH|nr:cation transporter [Pseudochelatococcus lubricantis]NIJ56238.1 putative Co/Zn/Cd cation transporter (cation efflux family) [Pseudochelatococcus lubricantis]
MQSEQGVLRVSIVLTVFMSGLGILFGLLAGSSAIVFDGIYELTDAAMTTLALLVARLIAAGTSGSPSHGRLVERFTMGFWHLEPMVLGLNGTMLIGAAIYALINAIDAFLSGGRLISFDYAIVYALISLVAEVGMGLYARSANQTIRSDLLALDAKGWLMSAAMTVAWLAAFVFGYLVQGTQLAWISPYIDPAVLAAVCLVVIPMPIGTVRRALADILLVTPADLKRHVDTVAQEMVQRYGFVSYRAYVARVGRGRQIELYFIVPPAWPAKRLEEWDKLRDEIGKALGDDSPDRWLTIVFTTDPEWAE